MASLARAYGHDNLLAAESNEMLDTFKAKAAIGSGDDKDLAGAVGRGEGDREGAVLVPKHNSWCELRSLL